MELITKRHYTAIISLVLAAVVFITLNVQGISEKLVSVQFSIIAGLLSYIAQCQFWRHYEIKEIYTENSLINRKLDECIYIGKQAIENDKQYSTLSNQTAYLHELEEIPRAIGNFAAETAIAQLDFRRTHINVLGKELSYKCYERLWHHLTNDYPRTGRPLICRTTHASDMRFWHDPFSHDVVTLQKQFLRKRDKGDRIFRILIDRDQPILLYDENNTELVGRMGDYIHTLKIMEDHGINCAYLNVHLELNGDGRINKSILDSDLCLISESKCSAVWKLTSQERVESFSIRTDAESYARNLGIWDNAYSELKQINYAELIYDHTIVDLLERTRRKFVDEHDVIARRYGLE